jgi:hypothetical protein
MPLKQSRQVVRTMNALHAVGFISKVTKACICTRLVPCKHPYKNCDLITDITKGNGLRDAPNRGTEAPAAVHDPMDDLGGEGQSRFRIQR